MPIINIPVRAISHLENGAVLSRFNDEQQHLLDLLECKLLTTVLLDDARIDVSTGLKRMHNLWKDTKGSPYHYRGWLRQYNKVKDLKETRNELTYSLRSINGLIRLQKPRVSALRKQTMSLSG